MAHRKRYLNYSATQKLLRLLVKRDISDWCLSFLVCEGTPVVRMVAPPLLSCYTFHSSGKRVLRWSRTFVMESVLPSLCHINRAGHFPSILGVSRPWIYASTAWRVLIPLILLPNYLVLARSTGAIRQLYELLGNVAGHAHHNIGLDMQDVPMHCTRLDIDVATSRTLIWATTRTWNQWR